MGGSSPDDFRSYFDRECPIVFAQTPTANDELQNCRVEEVLLSPIPAALHAFVHGADQIIRSTMTDAILSHSVYHQEANIPHGDSNETQ
ncbi:hypothetical protein PMIN01_04763 [Paraphaeosphaeria minitans]|uniref:Uncharacterized protein n=1 Tax=Paraphaeosphaeria minitans TaxID=565426 RepID=A0A9P6GMU5_9PLEO|nr:hypothetical protein PMIN01_04763 [Paraphaeosphaeria minitans]